jgi:hypothetical protein
MLHAIVTVLMRGLLPAQAEARRFQEALAAVACLAAVCSVILQLLQLARAGEDGSLQAQLGLMADSLWGG